MEERAPIALPSYTIGTEAQPNHYDASCTRDEAAQAASALRVGDAAFIKRSDLKWTYAVVTERNVTPSEGEKKESVTLRFEVDAAKNRKSFPDNQWGKYIRVISVQEDTIAADDAGVEVADKSDVSVSPSIKSSKSTKSKSSIKSKASVKSVKGAIKSLVGKSSKDDKKKDKTEAVEEKKEEEEEAPAPVVEETEVVAAVETPAVEAVEEAKAEEETKEEPAATAETEALEVKSEDQPATIESKPSTGWFSSFFGSSPKPEVKKVEESAAAKTETAEEIKTETVEEKKDETKETAAPTPILKSPTKAATVENVESRDDKSSKENHPESSEQLTMPKTFLPASPASSVKSPLTKRNPSNILKFKFGKSPTSPLAPTSPGNSVSFARSPPTSPTAATPKGKEWFDPEATECDYDKNPTDLFQALEAREFEYAFEMYEQTNDQFTKDCKTWVIAKGLQKGQSLRFRALPLHAAIVFDAPDELIIKILRAYPKASRGRDVKGRLPIHLAFEHQTSDQIIALIIDAFPKGFFAKDKKEMTPLDHVNGNTTRSYMARFIPQIMAAKIEEEREKWNVEANMLLEHQKATLQNDEEFMADVIQHVQEEVEAHNMAKIELLEANYQKEIELLKKKHDSETQALLEGFEVKLNFERKLNKLKVKQ